MSEQPISIIKAKTSEDWAAFRALIVEYVEWTHARYPSLPGADDAIDSIMAFQSLDKELADLPAKYGPPVGRTLLAISHGEPIGAVAYRDLGGGNCEMKRLYVPDRFRGFGAGKKLCLELFSAAREAGYSMMKLDTGPDNHEAIALYESLGFQLCEPYIDYPTGIALTTVFFEKPL